MNFSGNSTTHAAWCWTLPRISQIPVRSIRERRVAKNPEMASVEGSWILHPAPEFQRFFANRLREGWGTARCEVPSNPARLFNTRSCLHEPRHFCVVGGGPSRSCEKSLSDTQLPGGDGTPCGAHLPLTQHPQNGNIQIPESPSGVPGEVAL